jgi:hypothetical protein
VCQDTALGTAVLVFATESSAKKYKRATNLSHAVQGISSGMDLLNFLDKMPPAIMHVAVDFDPDKTREDVICLSDLELLLLGQVFSLL